MYAVGDSITYGLGASDRATTSYVAVLSAALGLGVVNKAVSGTALYGASPNISDQILSTPPPARHDIVVTTLGTNDSIIYGTDATALATFASVLEARLLYLTSRVRPAEPRDERQRVLDALRGTRPATRADGCAVWVGTTPYENVGHYAGAASPAAVDAYAAAITSAVANVRARGRRVYLVDIHAAYDPATMSDEVGGVHPNDTGHAVFAATFLAAMEALVA